MLDNCFRFGLFQYYEKSSSFISLPEKLKGINMVPSCAILQLFMGAITIFDEKDKRVYRPKYNFIELPLIEGKKRKITLNDYKVAFGVDDFEEKTKIDNYLLRDQKNNYIYKNFLHELTLALVYLDKSPCESFVHIYRMLEFISYTFPLIYVSRSKNYKGSYDSLKKFFGDDDSGELKFFSRYLDELFVGEDEDVKSVTFEIILQSDHVERLVKDFKMSIDLDKDSYQIDDCYLKINFLNMRSLLVNLRNKYFHMLAGREGACFQDEGYNINDLFASINPYFINWLASIYVKIFQYGIQSIE